jgi:TonB family protein
MLALVLMAAALTDGPQVTSPDWLSKPTGRDMARAYPRRAEEQNVIGRVYLTCRVTASGALDECKATEEDPPGYDFDKAALSVAPKFKMRPVDTEGRPVAGRSIHIPILFVLPSPAAPAIQVSVSGGAGRAEVDCRISTQRRFENCQVLRSTMPALEPLALKVVGDIVLSGKEPAGQRVLLPIDFIEAAQHER